MQEVECLPCMQILRQVHGTEPRTERKFQTWDRFQNAGCQTDWVQLSLTAWRSLPKLFHFAFPSAVTFGPVSSLGWRKISLWGAEIPKSPQSSVERRGGSVCSSRLRSLVRLRPRLPFLHLPRPGPLHLLAPKLGAATGCYRWVRANSKYQQHRESSSSQEADLSPPPDSGLPTNHLWSMG